MFFERQSAKHMCHRYDRIVGKDVTFVPNDIRDRGERDKEVERWTTENSVQIIRSGNLIQNGTLEIKCFLLLILKH